MTSADINNFVQHILTNNPYFDKGFGNAFKEQGVVYAEDVTAILFPQDTYGNYFYLRHDGEISFREERGSEMANRGPGRIGFIDAQPMALVAVMRDANAYTLLNNLRNSAMGYNALVAVPTGALLVREQVVIDEMRGAEDEEVGKALANLNNQTIIRIKLTVYKSWRGNTCITDPCKC